MSRIIVGFDPGLQRTGYGVIDASGLKPRMLEAGVIRISREGTLAERLSQLFDSAVEILSDHKPESVAIEELFSHYERPKTAILMGHARGVLFLSAARIQVPVASYLPTRVKKLLTGSGHCSKLQMQRAIQAEFALKTLPDPPDVADALAIALCHFHAR